MNVIIIIEALEYLHAAAAPNGQLQIPYTYQETNANKQTKNKQTQTRHENNQRRNNSNSIQFSSQENKCQNKTILKQITRKDRIYLYP